MAGQSYIARKRRRISQRGLALEHDASQAPSAPRTSVTLASLRLELLFAADDATRAALAPSVAP